MRGRLLLPRRGKGRIRPRLGASPFSPRGKGRGSILAQILERAPVDAIAD